jgi:hypothetical protein
MPPIVPQPKLIQAVPYYSPNETINHQIANVVWFVNNSAGTPSLAQLESISNFFDAQWYAFWNQVGASGKDYIGSVITDFSSTMGAVYDSRVGFTAQSGVHGTPNPAQVCGLISLSNGERYRGGHFRIYLPWIGEAVLDVADTSLLSATAVSNLTLAFNNFVLAMNSSGILGGQNMVLYRHRTDPLKASLFGIHSYQPQRVLATQRRRLRKVPRHKKA